MDDQLEGHAMPLSIPLQFHTDDSVEGRLANVRVLVAGGSPLGLRVVSMLQKVGVRNVTEAFGATGDALIETVNEHDLVVNACRSVGEMLELADACVRTGRPFVWGEVQGNVHRSSVFWPQAPGEWPLTTLRHLYPVVPEVDPEPADPDLEIVWSRLATVLITEVQKLIQGIGEPLIGRLLEVDTIAADWDVREITPAQPPRKS